MGTAWTSNAMESHTLTSLHPAPRDRDMDDRDHKLGEPSNVQFTSQFSVSEIVAESKSDPEEDIASAV